MEHITQHKSTVNAAGGVSLPQINSSVEHSGKNVVGTPGGVNGPRAVIHRTRSIQDHCLIYRSVPPTPRNFTLTDMIGAEITPPNPVKSKKLGLAGSTPSEFAKRFMTRPTTQPKVVEFNIGRIKSDKRRRGVNGFFPPVKLRVSAKTHSQPQKEIKESIEDAISIPSNNSTSFSDLNTACREWYESCILPMYRQPRNTYGCSEMLFRAVSWEESGTQSTRPITSINNAETDEDTIMKHIERHFHKSNPPHNPQLQMTEEPSNVWQRHKLQSLHTLSSEDSFVTDKVGNRTLVPGIKHTHYNSPDITQSCGSERRVAISYQIEPRFSNRKLHRSMPNVASNENDNDAFDTSAGNPISTSGEMQQHVGLYTNTVLNRSLTRESFTNHRIRVGRNPAQLPSNLQLVPTMYSEVQPKSASRSISRSSKHSVPARKTPESVRTAPVMTESVIVYPETFECDDLSYLPPPKRILPRRDVPWVFRYKVKRNMNELSKIMASKPQQMVDV